MMRVGMELPPYVVANVSAQPMKVIAVLMQDPNPIHWDRAECARLGLGSRVVNQGPITMSWLAELAAQTAGGHDRVRRLRARFVGQVLEGDTVTCRGRVIAVEAGTATLELVVEVDGEPRVTATAVISLPEP